MTSLTVIEYLCHKWPPICSTCRKHSPFLSSIMTYHGFVTRFATSGAGTASSPFWNTWVHLQILAGFVLLDLLCNVYVLSIVACPFSFDHCVVCPSIYGFWLPLWYLQTLLIRHFGYCFDLICFILLLFLLFLFFCYTIRYFGNKNNCMFLSMSIH